MPTLFVLSGPLIGRSFEVASEALVGRTGDCDVPLVAPSISRRHARLVLEQGVWVLEDLDSRNGVFSGELRVTRLELADGDLFRLGDVELRFRLAGEPVAAPRPSANPAPPQVGPPSSPSPPRSRPVAAELDVDEIVLEGADAATEYVPAPRVARPAAPTSGPARQVQPAAAPARGGVARRGAPLAADVRQRDERPLLQFSRVADRGGVLTGDLSQYPAWMRIGALLLALALFAGIFFFAFRGTAAVKGRLAGADAGELEAPR